MSQHDEDMPDHMLDEIVDGLIRKSEGLPDHEYESEADDCDNWPKKQTHCLGCGTESTLALCDDCREEYLQKETERIEKAQQSAKERFGE